MGLGVEKSPQSSKFPPDEASHTPNAVQVTLPVVVAVPKSIAVPLALEAGLPLVALGKLVVLLVLATLA
jgi:hypothetical protein